MGVIILFLLFLYTLISYGFLTVIERYNIYFRLEEARIESGKLLLKSLSFGANNFLGRNFSFYTEELKLGREISLRNTFINLINLKKPKKKELLS